MEIEKLSAPCHPEAMLVMPGPLSRIAPAAAPPPRLHTGGVAAAMAALLLLSPLQMIAPAALHTQVAQARELASGRGSKVNKDPSPTLSKVASLLSKRNRPHTLDSAYLSAVITPSLNLSKVSPLLSKRNPLHTLDK